MLEKYEDFLELSVKQLIINKIKFNFLRSENVWCEKFNFDVVGSKHRYFSYPARVILD